ncbi:MAG: hypothetical protein ACRDT4_16090, partial [Micromonosporaceae bacterium]
MAVVDDAGRLLASVEVDDTPAGYAAVCALIAERCPESGPVRAAMATDTETSLVSLLLAAAGEPLALGDEQTVAAFANGEPAGAPDSHRRAVALARALQAGTLAAASQPAPRDLAALRPVLAAHRAATAGRTAAVTMLREVLRELYPAALRTFPDPGQPLALAALERLADPVQVARGEDGNAVGQLCAAGFPEAEVRAAVAALWEAVADAAARRSSTEAIGATVRNGVSAVRSADGVATALVSVIADHVEPRTGGRGFPAVPPVSGPPAAPPVSSPPAAPVSGQPAVSGPPVVSDPLTAPAASLPPGAGSPLAAQAAASTGAEVWPAPPGGIGDATASPPQPMPGPAGVPPPPVLPAGSPAAPQPVATHQEAPILPPAQQPPMRAPSQQPPVAAPAHQPPVGPPAHQPATFPAAPAAALSAPGEAPSSGFTPSAPVSGAPLPSAPVSGAPPSAAPVSGAPAPQASGQVAPSVAGPVSASPVF